VTQGCRAATYRRMFWEASGRWKSTRRRRDDSCHAGQGIKSCGPPAFFSALAPGIILEALSLIQNSTVKVAAAQTFIKWTLEPERSRSCRSSRWFERRHADPAFARGAAERPWLATMTN